MKVDFEFLFFRLLVFCFLMTLILLTFYIFGTYQSFLDATLETLFFLFRIFAWTGTVLSAFFQIALFTGKASGRWRRLTTLTMFLIFLALYILVEFLKAWIYPGAAS